MDKSKLLTGYKPSTTDFEMPDGEVLKLQGLTVSQRGKMSEAVRNDAVRGQALVVCMSADILDESDIDLVLEMDGKLVSSISDKILEISGLGGAVKNS
jgi:hypothetical protein